MTHDQLIFEGKNKIETDKTSTKTDIWYKYVYKIIN